MRARFSTTASKRVERSPGAPLMHTTRSGTHSPPSPGSEGSARGQAGARVLLREERRERLEGKGVPGVCVCGGGGVVRRPRRGAQISTRAPRDGHSGPPGQKAGRPPPYAEARAPPLGFTRGVERLEKAGSGPPTSPPEPRRRGPRKLLFPSKWAGRPGAGGGGRCRSAFPVLAGIGGSPPGRGAWGAGEGARWSESRAAGP